VGKTRLVQEFMGGKQGLYFYVPNAEEKTILGELSKVVEGEFFGASSSQASAPLWSASSRIAVKASSWP